MRKVHVRKKYPAPFERQDQMALVEWMRWNKIDHFMIGNEGKHTFAEHITRKAMGLLKGMPDLCLPIPRDPYHSLYLELKRSENGKLSPSQKEVIKMLRSNGNCVAVPEGLDNAMEYVFSYLSRDIVKVKELLASCSLYPC